MALKKQKKSSKIVIRSGDTTKRASTTSHVKKNSSKTQDVSKLDNGQENYGNLQWTPARTHSFIVSVLRTGTRRWPPKYQTLEEAKVGKKINVGTGRLANHFRCKLCRKSYPSSNVEVDHITPVVGPEGFSTWDEYIKRMFVGKEGFQVLCKPCHKKKTLKEKGERLSK